MKPKNIITELVMIVVIDLILVIAIKDWSDTSLLATISMNLVFITGIAFISVSPEGSNSNIFAVSTEFYAVTFLIISVIACALIIWFTPDVSITALTMGVIILLEVFTMGLNHRVNRFSSISDSSIEEEMEKYRSAQNDLDRAMNLCKDRVVRTRIEKTYDRVRSVVSISNKDADYINSNIQKYCREILEAARSGKNSDIYALCDEIDDALIKRERLIPR